jgi:hypothetical protein
MQRSFGRDPLGALGAKSDLACPTPVRRVSELRDASLQGLALQIEFKEQMVRIANACSLRVECKVFRKVA